MIHFTLFTFQMYSSSLRFQQKEPKNHSNGMNNHKNVEGDQHECILAALSRFRDCIILCVCFFQIFSLNYQQGVTHCCICIDK